MSREDDCLDYTIMEALLGHLKDEFYFSTTFTSTDLLIATIDVEQIQYRARTLQR